MREFWKDHGTKVLGTIELLQGMVVGIMGITGLIPPAHLPYWALASVIMGGLVIRRGFINSLILKNKDNDLQ